jgi:hypothetical protein
MAELVIPLIIAALSSAIVLPIINKPNPPLKPPNQTPPNQETPNQETPNKTPPNQTPPNQETPNQETPNKTPPNQEAPYLKPLSPPGSPSRKPIGDTLNAIIIEADDSKSEIDKDLQNFSRDIEQVLDEEKRGIILEGQRMGTNPEVIQQDIDKLVEEISIIRREAEDTVDIMKDYIDNETLLFTNALRAKEQIDNDLAKLLSSDEISQEEKNSAIYLAQLKKDNIDREVAEQLEKNMTENSEMMEKITNEYTSKNYQNTLDNDNTSDDENTRNNDEYISEGDEFQRPY